MPHAPSATVRDEAPIEPQAPLGHLSRLEFALARAAGIDEIAASMLTGLAALPGVHRVGFALSEGGGRRLRFTASDRVDAAGFDVEWCHIDAYDDVPLTSVVRTGLPVLGLRDALHPRFDAFVADQPAEVWALAALPLPGGEGPIGGLIVYLDDEWAFDEAHRGLLEAAARRTAEAVRRVRVADDSNEPDEPPDAGIHESDGTRSARMVLDDDPRAAGAARRFLREFLAAQEVAEEVSETAELCLSELVTNAIVHAVSRCELRAGVDGSVLTVSVRDRGRSAQQASLSADPDPLRVHGRGLQLVEALADRWGYERDEVGTSVWFALDL